MIHVVDGLDEQVHGALPASITLPEADGNSVIIDIGGGLDMLYTNPQPGSIAVSVGEQVRRRDPIGRVGNSSAPHLHFHLMGGLSPLTFEGVHFVFDSFVVTRQITSTAAFDQFKNAPGVRAIGDLYQSCVLAVEVSGFGELRAGTRLEVSFSEVRCRRRSTARKDDASWIGGLNWWRYP